MSIVEKHTANRLINEPSPYLQHHAHNPVDWYPWCEEAFERAKSENKPIVLSIGYSACHWCHVMERESFEDVTVAQLMNKNFICIKLDREERPDIDNIYMNAVMAMNGNGGWPLNVFLTPNKEPFMGGTYFPTRPFSNMPSWTQVLEFVCDVWRNEQDRIQRQAGYLVDFLKSEPLLDRKLTIDSSELTIDNSNQDFLHNIYSQLESQFDKNLGGFGQAPKFLNTFALNYLIFYSQQFGHKDALNHVDTTLRKMCSGGIFDHIGGGVARYSTDIHWFVPHFEKMLYDNALIINVLCSAYKITQNELFANTAEKALNFIRRELTSPEFGFYSSIDADSEGVEGKYYVWSKEEISEVLTHDTEMFCDFFSITDDGNWESANILHHDGNLEKIAKKYKICPSELTNRIDSMINKLSKQRAHRIAPSKDEKIVLMWNALTISAICKAYKTFANEEYKTWAIESLAFISDKLYNKQLGLFFHNYKDSKAYNPAFLDDYASLIRAYIDVYDITFDLSYIDKANELTAFVIKHFLDTEDDLFFYTTANQSDVIARKKDLNDGVTASGNSIMAGILLKLSSLTGNRQYFDMSRMLLNRMIAIVNEYPLSFANYACEISSHIFGITEISVVGKNYKVIARDIQRVTNSNTIVMASEFENSSYPLLSNRGLEGKTLIYLCRDHTCFDAVETVAELQNYMKNQLK